MRNLGRAFPRPILGGLCFLAASAVSASSALAVDSTVELEHWGRRPANLFAVVDLAGTLVHGNGVSNVAHLATGQYEVTFTREVGQCAYVATTVNAYSQALQAFTAGGPLEHPEGSTSRPRTRAAASPTGPSTSWWPAWPPAPSSRWSATRPSLVRATRGTTLTALGSGRYEVKFPHRFGDWADACAYLATVGDPGSALVFNPSGVYTGSGPDDRTVYIETKNPGGGLQDGVPFHLAVICAPAPQTRDRGGAGQRHPAAAARSSPAPSTAPPATTRSRPTATSPSAPPSPPADPSIRPCPSPRPRWRSCPAPGPTLSAIQVRAAAVLRRKPLQRSVPHGHGLQVI